MKFTEAKVLNFQNGLLQKKEWTDDTFVVMSDFIFYIDYGTKKEYVKVEKWFETNFWSIPIFIKPFLNPTAYISYIMHDYLYSIEAKIHTNEWEDYAPTRQLADELLREWIKIEWWTLLIRTCVYYGVRLWGKNYFKKS